MGSKQRADNAPCRLDRHDDLQWPGGQSCPGNIRGALMRLCVAFSLIACSGSSEGARGGKTPVERKALDSGGTPDLGYARGAHHQPGLEGHAGVHDDVIAPMQHAFIVTGDETLFLVHMTNMWLQPHVYQVIVRVRLPDAVKSMYDADRREHPGAWYIVGNAASDKLIIPDIARRAKTSFRGALWRGWPDPGKPGTPDWPWANTPHVAADFDVEIENVVYYRRFDFNLERPGSLTYVLFGKGNEAHLQSYQTKQPDFDHILTLAARPAWLQAELLESGVHVNFPRIPSVPEPAESASGQGPAGADVYCHPPIKGGTYPVRLSGDGPERPLTIAREVFFSTFPVNAKDPCRSSEI
jgi:hypothetical protein